jgi:hypothetical protein
LEIFDGGIDGGASGRRMSEINGVFGDMGQLK